MATTVSRVVELVHAQAAHADPDLQHAGERVARGVDLLGDPHQVVVDVAEVVVRRVAAEAGQALDQVAAGGEQVALGEHDPAQVGQLALELEDLAEAIRCRAPSIASSSISSMRSSMRCTKGKNESVSASSTR